MKIIINSDILYSPQLVRDKLPNRLDNLCRACADLGVKIALPLTSLLEFKRHQQQLVESEVTAIRRAYRTLDENRVAYQGFEPRDLVRLPDLVELFRSLGVEVHVIDPTLEDFEEAHRRACLHEAPHPPDTKSDEMRDLVIWVIAIRIASEENGAILLSRDSVHTHSRGNEEADNVLLSRVASVEEALEILQVETPKGARARRFLAPVWDELMRSGLPVLAPMSLRQVSNTVFVDGVEGPYSARFTMTTRGSSHEDVVTAKVEIDIRNGIIVRVALSDIRVGDSIWNGGFLEIHPNKPLSITTTNFQERMSDLRAIIGG